jgi:hypothetical protein
MLAEHQVKDKSEAPEPLCVGYGTFLILTVVDFELHGTFLTSTVTDMK